MKIVVVKSLLTLSVLLFSYKTWAQRSPTAPDYSMASIEAGFKMGSADLQNATSTKQVTGFQLGGSVVLNFTDKFGLKTGLFYVERPFKSEFAGAVTAEGKVTYFEVPAFLMYKLEDYAGIYAGPSLAMKLGDEGTPALTNVKSMITPLTFGAQFKFLPNFGLNLFFESAGELSTGVNSSRAVGVNLMFALD